jgi:hypothetical protein
MTAEVLRFAPLDELGRAIDDDFRFLDDWDVSDLRSFALEEAEQFVGGLSQALIHGIRCGAALVRIHEKIEPGKWDQWVRDNFSSVRQARTCQRWYIYRSELVAAGAVDVASADAALRGLPKIRPAGRPQVLHDEQLAEIRKLKSDGWSYDRLGERYGCSRTAVRTLLYPEQAKKWKQAQRRRYSAGQRALRQAERAKEAKAAGIDKLWSDANRLLDLLDPAILALTDREQKQLLRSAADDFRNAIGKIHKALGAG